MKPTIEMLAGYNVWANGRVYDAVEALPDEDYRADLGAFFGSIHGTLNHLLTADYIWMRRFTGEGPNPDRLDAIQHEAFGDLRAARNAADQRIADYVAGLGENDIAGDLVYRTMSNPAEVRQPLGGLLVNFFNHHTHHRGQVHAMLTRLTGDAPSLDMILFQREAGISEFRPL
ncbi:DinB family protein [Methyloligella halotolerans]|uniref:DinB family protein n=1 Tax=Methyloligella halotolerans TaxID=1177755 RepID=A0A1E2RZF1_9HYPH|nr:DinB family protein [Methyloligella halotolerans]ODA67584.1 DinB family protein [Methyloligella halotolerans]